MLDFDVLPKKQNKGKRGIKNGSSSLMKLESCQSTCSSNSNSISSSNSNNMKRIQPKKEAIKRRRSIGRSSETQSHTHVVPKKRLTVCSDITVAKKVSGGSNSRINKSRLMQIFGKKNTVHNSALPIDDSKFDGGKKGSAYQKSLGQENDIMHTQQTLVPAFHQPWYQPYKPALSNDISYLPKGVVDIDSLSLECCLNSYQTHGGHSWVTSTRRCGCVKDSNHNGKDCLTEAYLGSYGIERYGMVGLAGKVRGSESINAKDWKVEQRWLDETRQELLPQNINVKGDGVRLVPSPTSILDASTRQEFASLLPTSIEKHLDYIARQPCVNIHNRAVLIDWLHEVCSRSHNRQSLETFLLCVMLLDRSLACSYPNTAMGTDNNGKSITMHQDDTLAIGSDDVQLLGCACLLISSKLTAVLYPLSVDELVILTDNTYTQKEIVGTEAAVCKALKFDLSFVTPVEYLDRFLRASYVSAKNSTSSSSAIVGMNNPTNSLMEKLVHYLLDLGTLEYKLVMKKPSLVTAAAIYLARVQLGIRDFSEPLFEVPSRTTSSVSNKSTIWSKTLEYYTGYDTWHLEDTVKLLHDIWANASTSEYPSMFDRHSSSGCKKVALRTVVNKDDLGFL